MKAFAGDIISRMRIAWCGIAVLALALTACTTTYGPKEFTSATMLDAMKHATANIDTLNAHRLDGVLIYSPLYVEAEKSISSLAAASSGRINDQNAVFQARQCVKDVEDVREFPTVTEGFTVSDMCVKEMYTYIR